MRWMALLAYIAAMIFIAILIAIEAEDGEILTSDWLQLGAAMYFLIDYRLHRHGQKEERKAEKEVLLQRTA